MRMKSYFAESVEAAMGQARREMGPDALLVNSRKAPSEARAVNGQLATALQEGFEFGVVHVVAIPGGHATSP